MPWLGAAHEREAARRRRHPDSLLDLDASVAQAGPEQRAIESLRSRARYSWRRDATRYQPLLDPAGRHADQADCQLALLALLEATVFEIFPGVQPFPHEMLSAQSPHVLALCRSSLHPSTTPTWLA